MKNEAVKGAVLDALAHDIKTPLTSIKASVSTLIGDTSLCPRERELLCIISEETERLERIVSESIEIAQIELLGVEPERRFYDAKETVEAALCGISGRSSGRLQFDIPEDLPAIAIDFRLIKLVLRQIVDNAVKYSPVDLPVTVTAAEKGNCIIFSIGDHCAGIPSDDQERIFDRNYRGRNEGIPADGMGMGLAIAKRIVDAHGGQISVESRPGCGCVFHVSLPISNG